VVLRIYLGKKLSETTSPWFKNYLQKGKDLWIIPSTSTTSDFGQKITRRDLGLFIYRVSNLKK
jgi:hypothetical protein